MNRTRVFKTEGDAARWLEETGYVYGGHLFDEGDETSLQTTAWINGAARASLTPLEDGRWVAELLSDED